MNWVKGTACLNLFWAETVDFHLNRQRCTHLQLERNIEEAPDWLDCAQWDSAHRKLPFVRVQLSGRGMLNNLTHTDQYPFTVHWCNPGLVEVLVWTPTPYFEWAELCCVRGGAIYWPVDSRSLNIEALLATSERTLCWCWDLTLACIAVYDVTTQSCRTVSRRTEVKNNPHMQV